MGLDPASAPIELPARIGKYERRMKQPQQLSRKKRGSKKRRMAAIRAWQPATDVQR